MDRLLQPWLHTAGDEPVQKVVGPKPDQPDCLTRYIYCYNSYSAKNLQDIQTLASYADYIHSLSLTSADVTAYDIENKVLTLWWIWVRADISFKIQANCYRFIRWTFISWYISCFKTMNWGKKIDSFTTVCYRDTFAAEVYVEQQKCLWSYLQA